MPKNWGPLQEVPFFYSPNLETISMKKIILFLTAFLLLNSCSEKKEKNLDSQVIMMKVIAADPDARPVDNVLSNIPISCDHYGEGCVSVTKASVKSYNVLFVEFSSSDLAKEEAIKKKTMRFHNWIFDNIIDEKLLVNFFRKNLNAEFDHPEHDPFKN